MKKNKIKYLSFIILLFIAIVFIIPYLWMLSNSFKTTKEILINPTNIFPEDFSISGYVKVLSNSPFFSWLKNSLIVTITNTTVVLFTSTLVGFVFAKYQFRGKKILFMILLSTMMIPATTVIIPNFLLINFLNLYDSLGALIIPAFVSAYGIFMCKQFCEDIPDSMIECARLEGASSFYIYFHIILPLLKPAIASLTIFTFLTYWNDYLNPLIMLNKVENMTLPIALSFFASQHATDLSATMAASALIMIPVTIVFVMFQKQFVKGITMTGGK